MSKETHTSSRLIVCLPPGASQSLVDNTLWESLQNIEFHFSLQILSTSYSFSFSLSLPLSFTPHSFSFEHIFFTFPCIHIAVPQLLHLNDHGVDRILKLKWLQQGSPVLGPWTATGPWPVRNGATQQEVSSGRASEQSFNCIYSCSPLLTLLPELCLLSDQQQH